MFIRTVAKKNDRISLRIVENVKVDGKVKQKTVCGLGQFHKNETKEIEKFKKIGEKIIIDIKNESAPALPGFEHLVHAPKKRKKIVKKSSKTDKSNDLSVFDCSSSNLSEEARIHLGAKNVYGEIYKQMGLLDSIDFGYKKEDENELLRDIVLARIEKPASKRKCVANIKRDNAKEVDLDRVYRIMDKVSSNEKKIKEKIKNKTLGLFKQKINVAFFDVTTLYFESFIPDELRKSGYSKDNKFKETQVVLALMTTTKGLPLGYELYPGNTYEGGTFIKSVESLEENYDLENVFIVADRGMFNKENLGYLRERKINYIISAKLKSMGKEMKDKITSDAQKEINEQPGSWIKEYDHEGDRLIVNYSKKRADKNKKDREKLIERIEKKMKDGKVLLADLINNTGTKKYLKLQKKGAKEATLNTQKIEEEKKWDGLYGIVANCSGQDLSGKELIDIYRGLWQIEYAFRVNKHDLKMRPIFHWTPKRIKAHILICFMGYAVVTALRYELKKKGILLSDAAIREELSYIQASIIKDSETGKRFVLPSKITKLQKAIYNALDIPLNSQVKAI